MKPMYLKKETKPVSYNLHPIIDMKPLRYGLLHKIHNFLCVISVAIFAAAVSIGLGCGLAYLIYKLFLERTY